MIKNLIIKFKNMLKFGEKKKKIKKWEKKV